MRRLLLALVPAVAVFSTACKKSPPPAPPPPAPQPAATAEPGYAGISQPTPPAATPPAAPAPTVSAPDTVNIDKDDAENRLVKAEILKRIDLMPNLKDDQKDKLYIQVERARGMGRVITIPFASGTRTPQAPDVTALCSAIHLPQIEKFSRDPTVVFVVLGYADKKGDPKANLEISTKRADSVASILKDRAGIVNVVHAVGMGSSEIFDSARLEKNRVVEVWAVLP